MMMSHSDSGRFSLAVAAAAVALLALAQLWFSGAFEDAASMAAAFPAEPR